MQPSATATNILPQTAFGDPHVSLTELVRDRTLYGHLKDSLSRVLTHFESNHLHCSFVAERILHMARIAWAVSAYEREAYVLLWKLGFLTRISDTLASRAATIVEQIRPHIVGGKILDIGCGDGRVGELLQSSGADVSLCDVSYNTHLSRVPLPFVLLEDGQSLPYQPDSYDTVLLLNVLHHSDDPVRLIHEAGRILRPGGRLLVIESAFGVEPSDPHLDNSEETAAFVSLITEQQRLVSIFMDHFYNRIVNYHESEAQKFHLPFNFSTPARWSELFAQSPFKQVELQFIGVDQPLIPVYHTLHAVDVLK